MAGQPAIPGPSDTPPGDEAAPSDSPASGDGDTQPLAPSAGDPANPDEPDPTELSGPTLIGDVSFTQPSGTFLGELSVAMSTGVAGAEIRYTTDGELPTVNSTAYDGSPLALTSTTQLRAQAFVEGAPAGLPSTAIYILRDFDFSSDIPIVIMEGYAGGKPDKSAFIDLAFMVFEPEGGAASLGNVPVLSTRAGYRLRGQSSANFDKAPYRVELWDNNDEDADHPMLGMPREADWAMVGPYRDKSLIRNAFVYSLAAEMSLSVMQLRFAEVFINQDGGPLQESDYQGVYAVTQTIKNQKTRLDLRQLREDVTTLPDISGGYIFKFDQAAVDDDEVTLTCTGAEPMRGGFGNQGDQGGTCWADLVVVDPEPINQQQLDYITGYVQEFHDALHAQPLGDYMQYIDALTFVDHFIINEITRDVDAYIRSHYYHKDREGLLTAGPVWDYNFSLDSLGTDIEGWQWEDGRRGTNDWFQILAVDPAFLDQVKVRWQELREGILSDAQLDTRISEIAAPLANAAPRDIERWPVGEGGGFDFGMGGDDEDEPETWEGQVQKLRDWVPQRMAWLDSQLMP